MPTLGPMRTLDRMGPRRTDEAWIAERVAASDTRYLLTIEHKPCIVATEPGTLTGLRWFSHEEIVALGIERHPVAFLGVENGARAYFAMDITEHRAKAVPGGPFILKPYVDLRSLAVQGALSPEELSLAGEARALAEWHNTHRCCGHCGSTTDIKDAGWRRKCWSCGRDHFPRTDPVVIMVVIHAGACLLGRQKTWLPGMYSALAGFMEPGETIEDAARREILEESGIRIGAVHYIASQPWPFPSSLMIGLIGEAESSDIKLDDQELEDARWFQADEARAMLAGTHPSLRCPPPMAIANHLLESALKRCAAIR